MPSDLHKLADAVEDESSFVRFVAALAADWEEERQLESENPASPYGPGALRWENGSIGTFLDAAQSWAEATAQGTPFYQVPENAWRRAAQILFAGKFYE
jgi:hypothetical protein